MSVTYNNYLDFPGILINEIFGDVWLFYVIGLLAVTIFGIKYNLPYIALVANAILFTGFVVSFAYNSFLWMVIIVIVAVVFYGILARILAR